MTKLYYLLNSERYPGEDSTREWSSHFKKTMQCRCGNVKREAHLEIDLDDDPVGLPINVVDFGPCGIIRNDVLDLLHDHVAQSLTMGNVSVRGRRLPDYTAYLPIRSRTLCIRGGPLSMFKRCQLCMQNVYIALGDTYILQGDVAERRDCYATTEYAIVVSSAFIRTHDLTYPELLRPLPIQNDSSDGLPLDLKSLPDEFSLNFGIEFGKK